MANSGSFFEEKIAVLETENQDLKTDVQTLKTELQLYKEEYDQLLQKYAQAIRDRFGKKSERFVDSANTDFEQLPLFPTTDSTDVAVSTDSGNPGDIETITYTRKKKGTQSPDIANIPTREIIIPVPEADRLCVCGCQKEIIGYEVRQRLNFQPAIFELLIEKREKRACRKGCGQNEDEIKNGNRAVVTAPAPNHILSKCKASESLLAYIAVSKVLDRQPLYHLEKSIDQRYGWHIPRQTMARWMIQLSDKLQPLINLMKDEVIGYDIAALDATTLQVLEEPGRSPETKSQAYCIRGGPPDKRVILYEYNAYSQRNFVSELFLDYKGVIHCDASPVFNGIGGQPDIHLSYCHAHARRKFEQIEKADRKNKNSAHSLAKQAMQFYKELYQIERTATEKSLTPEKRLELRIEKSKPLLAKFLTWLQESQAKTLPKSPIGQAIAYTLTHWKGLQVYLTDGRVEIDNNATERDIKPFVIARKNFLFACTQKGADALGVHFSLILTARLHNLNPMAYYTEILKRIPGCKTLRDYEGLLPWNVRLDGGI